MCTLQALMAPVPLPKGRQGPGELYFWGNLGCFGPLSEDFIALVGVWSRVWSRFGCVTMAFPCDFVNFTRFWPWFLRDGIASGRGVHRFWGVRIQKSRSLFGPFPRFLRNFGICGVGVLYWHSPGRGLKFSFVLGRWLLVTGYFTPEVDWGVGDIIRDFDGRNSYMCGLWGIYWCLVVVCGTLRMGCVGLIFLFVTALVRVIYIRFIRCGMWCGCIWLIRIYI